MSVPSHVYIVDDEDDVRASIEFVLQTEGIACSAYRDGIEFLQGIGTTSACVLLDVRMPLISGLEVQAQISLRRINVATIIMSGHTDVPMAVEAMKLGAKEVLQKPFTGDELLETLSSTWQEAEPELEEHERIHRAYGRIAELSHRERQVLAAVAAGQSNPKIADQLGLSVRTVEMHRARMMSRIAAASLPQALDMWRDAEAWTISARRVAGQPQRAI